MASMLATIFTVLVAARVALALGPANSNPIATLWTFPNETWIENLAVRANGDVLCTSLNRNAVYKVNPFDHIAKTLHQFSSAEG
jgi:streptogramin lyase